MVHVCDSLSHMAVSINRGAPIWTPMYYMPDCGDAQDGPLKKNTHVSGELLDFLVPRALGLQGLGIWAYNYSPP